MKLEGLRRQLQEAADGLIKGRRELVEAHRQLQECARERDNQRKDSLDLRRLLGDETREKEAIQASNQELRASIKRAESDNSRYGCHTEPQISCRAIGLSGSFETHLHQLKTSRGGEGAESCRLRGVQELDAPRGNHPTG